MLAAGTSSPVATPSGKLPLRLTADGWFVLEIRGERDVPGYVPAEVGRGMSEQTFRREVLGDWSASAGKLVFPEYGDLHEPVAGLPFDPTRPLLCGWDLPAATGGTPAFVATQLSAQGQWLIYGSVLPDAKETVGVWDFAERVAYYLKRTFADPAGISLNALQMRHYGDPAGNQRALAGGVQSTRTELRSAYEIIARGEQIEAPDGKIVERPGWGWTILPGEVSLTKRLECVRTRLTTLVGGGPALLVSPSATMIRTGFRGGYHYHERQDGRYELDPAKNKYSHIFDALAYCASRVFTEPVAGRDPEAEYLARLRRQQPATRVAGGARGRR